MPEVHKRVRIAGATVSLTVYLDDGETLEPVQVQPIVCSVADLGTLDIEGIRQMLQSQVDGGNGAVGLASSPHPTTAR